MRSLTALVALGTHVALSDEELARWAGYAEAGLEATYPGMTVVQHRWWDPDTFVHLGTIPAGRVRELTGGRLDMAARVDTSHLLTMRAAALHDAGENATSEAAMAKLVASENASWVTSAAVQTHGGWGYSREFPVARWMNDAKLEELEEGTSDIQRLIISRALERTR